MPLYEYRAVETSKSCYHCSKGFELIEPISAEATKVCPACGEKVERIISAPAIGGSQSNLDDRAKNAGFTKLRKLGKGEYEKEY